MSTLQTPLDPGPRPGKVRLSMPRVVLLACGTGLVLAGATYGVVRASEPPPVLRYVTAPVRRGTVTLTYQDTGQVLPTATTTFTLPDASASVSALRVQVGQAVVSGQILGQMTDPGLQTALSSAEAALQKAQAGLSAAESPATSNGAAASIQEARDNVTVAADTLQNDQALLASLTIRASANGPVHLLVAAGQTVTAGEALATQGGTTYSSPAAGTVASVEIAQGASAAPSTVLLQVSDPALASRVVQDESALAASQVALNNAFVTDSAAALSAAEAQARSVVQGDQASVAALTNEVAALTMRAPFAGMVTAADSDPASVNTPVVTVASGGRSVTVTVPETNIGEIHVGQHLVASLPAYPGHRLTGVVTAIAPVAAYTNGVASFSVTAGLTGWPKFPYYGVSSNVSIVLQKVKNALTVPLAALRTHGGHAVVLVLNGSTTKAVPVHVILQTPSKVAVRSSFLHVGTQVVVAVPTSSAGKLRLKARGRGVHRSGARRRGSRKGGKA